MIRRIRYIFLKSVPVLHNTGNRLRSDQCLLFAQLGENLVQQTRGHKLKLKSLMQQFGGKLFIKEMTINNLGVEEIEKKNLRRPFSKRKNQKGFFKGKNLKSLIQKKNFEGPSSWKKNWMALLQEKKLKKLFFLSPLSLMVDP